MLLLILGIFFILLFTGVPIAVSMGVACIPYFVFSDGAMGITIAQRIFTVTDSFTLCAMPFFMLAGGLMEVVGITDKIVDFAGSCVGHIRGGMAHTTTLSGVLMAGVSGSGNADVAALGSLLVPPMRKAGYDPGYSIVCISTAGGLGPIIPPSITMVILASATGLSTGSLFMAGVIPGILLAISYMVLNYRHAILYNIPKSKFVGFRTLGHNFIGALGALFMPVIIIGGILFGIFTPTEAGVAATVYGIGYGIVNKKLTVKSFYEACVGAAKSTAGCMFVIQVSTVLSYIFTSLKLTKMVDTFVHTYCGNSVWLFFGFVVIICLIAGCFIDSNATMLMLAPIFLPVARSLGVPDMQFCMIFILALLTGGYTPPVGLFLYIVAGMDGTPPEKSFKFVPQFLLATIAVIVLLILFEPLTTFIPSLT